MIQKYLIYIYIMNYYDEDFLKTCDEETIIYLYENQYDEDKNIPAIDKDYEDGYDVYKIYIYGNYTKYYCKMFQENDLEISNIYIYQK